MAAGLKKNSWVHIREQVPSSTSIVANVLVRLFFIFYVMRGKRQKSEWYEELVSCSTSDTGSIGCSRCKNGKTSFRGPGVDGPTAAVLQRLKRITLQCIYSTANSLFLRWSLILLRLQPAWPSPSPIPSSTSSNSRYLPLPKVLRCTSIFSMTASLPSGDALFHIFLNTHPVVPAYSHTINDYYECWIRLFRTSTIALHCDVRFQTRCFSFAATHEKQQL